MTEWLWWQDWSFKTMLVVVGSLGIAPIPAYAYGIISFETSMILPWMGVLLACLWVMTVGQTIHSVNA